MNEQTLATFVKGFVAGICASWFLIFVMTLHYCASKGGC